VPKVRKHHHVDGITCTGPLTKDECDALYSAWQEEREDVLAARVAARTDPRDPTYWKGDDTKFGQKVRAIRTANAVEGGTLDAG
jgi:hypothetical protein